MKPEDDTRQFWVQTRQPCGHVISVLTDHGYDRLQAIAEIYDDNPGAAAQAVVDGDMSFTLVDAATYHAQIFDQVGA